MDVLNDLAALYRHVQDAEALQTFDDLSEHVGGDLVLAPAKEACSVARGLAPVQLHEHVITTVLDSVKQHLFKLRYQELQVDGNDD